MRHGLIIKYTDVAARLANEEAEIQALFFKIFLKELRACCETNYNAELQVLAINSHLTESERELIAMLGEDRG